jgi:hypothetical protein
MITWTLLTPLCCVSLIVVSFLNYNQSSVVDIKGYKFPQWVILHLNMILNCFNNCFYDNSFIFFMKKGVESWLVFDIVYHHLDDFLFSVQNCQFNVLQ